MRTQGTLKEHEKTVIREIKASGEWLRPIRVGGSWIGSWKPDSIASAAITMSPTQGIPFDEAADNFEY